MRVLVTGAAGFVGRHLVPALATAGHNVFAAVRPGQVAPEATTVEVDLAQPLEGSIPVVDAIVHLAQANVAFPDGAPDLFRVNAASTVELLDHARRCGARAFVLASSGSVYGLGEGRVREDDPRRAGDFYAATKRAAEDAVAAYAPYFATSVLRLFTPYGPAQERRLVQSIATRVREGTPVTLNDGGRPRLTPIFVGDVVRAVEASLEREGRVVVNVAGDEVVSIRTLAERIGELVGREPQFEEGGAPVAGDLLGDNSLLHELFGLELVPLERGLRETLLEHAPA